MERATLPIRDGDGAGGLVAVHDAALAGAMLLEAYPFISIFVKPSATLASSSTTACVVSKSGSGVVGRGRAH